MRVGHDRFSFILPTEKGLLTRTSELLQDSIVVVVEGGINWTRTHRADVWSTMRHTSAVSKFPPGLVVWGMPGDAPVWLAAGIQFHPLPLGSIMGPQGVPRPVDAFFAALELACETCHAKVVRVHGCEGWTGEQAWKRNALGKIWRQANAHGVEIQRPGLPAKRFR